RGPPPPETGHLHAKAVTVHNGFPEPCNAGSGSGDAELREEPLPTTLAEELKAEGRDEGCRGPDERDEPAGHRPRASRPRGRGGRRRAEVQQAAQVRDRLAPHVESFEDPHADVGGERLEALLVQRDLAAAGVHGRNPMSEWGLERFPSVRPRPNRAGGNGDV